MEDINNLIDKLEDTSSLVDFIYPVGSIYISVNDVSPATLFGGTWEAIKDRFLIAASETYEAESTGGSKDAIIPYHTHTFTGNAVTSGGSSAANTGTESEHTHSVGAHSHGLNSHTHSIPALSGTAASAGSHEHYLQVFYKNINYNMEYTPNVAFGGTNEWLGYIHPITTDSNALKTNNTGAHTHPVTTTANTSGAASGNTANSTAFNSGAGSSHSHTMAHTHSVTASGNNSYVGTEGNTKDANMPPYLAVYIWKRTS